MKLTLYTDGGARGNPGPAGAGGVVIDDSGNRVLDFSEFLGERTNNWAEYQAVILGLKGLKRKYGNKTKDTQLEVRLDSQLVQRQLSREYQIKEESLFSQFIAVHNLIISSFPNISFTHVPRGENNIADGLANEAMDKGGGGLFS
jgi:ribonuclease HI